MHSSLLFTFFLQAWCLVPIFAAPTSLQQPTPVDHNLGDFVGVRPGAYEQKSPDVNLKKISIHPGVIVGGPHPETGKYSVAMISKKLPHDPPQAPIDHFHPDSSVYGNIALHPPHQVAVHDMKPWKDERTGVRQTPLHRGDLHKLKDAMVPHVGWRAPTPPPFPPRPPQGSHPGSRAPAPRNGQHVNAHASGSNPAPGSSYRHRDGGSGSSTSRSHTSQKDNKGRRPTFSSKPSGGHPTRKAGEKRSLRPRGINNY